MTHLCHGHGRNDDAAIRLREMLQFSPTGEETMRRREFIALMGASVTWPFAAMAQQAGRTYRLGFLAIVARDAPPNMAFFEELQRLGVR